MTTLPPPCDSFKIQGCAKVVKRLQCGNLVTMYNVRTTLSQPCDSFTIQGCDKVVKSIVATLCQGCDNLVISVWVAILEFLPC